MTAIGTSHARIDGADKVRGTAPYAYEHLTEAAANGATATDAASSTTVVMIHTGRECRATSRACRAQNPRTGAPLEARSSGMSTAPVSGMNGQNAARPVRARSAGRKVSAESTAKTMPIEAIGPRARLLARSLRSRQSSPAMTVPPEARMGSNAPRQAVVVASHRRLPCAIASWVPSRNRSSSAGRTRWAAEDPSSCHTCSQHRLNPRVVRWITQGP